ncbi:MAG: hypothetical protein OXD36_14975 [Rhodobacter sp.]|nr:hypothetical protein [Rhodobacter sp.]
MKRLGVTKILIPGCVLVTLAGCAEPLSPMAQCVVDGGDPVWNKTHKPWTDAGFAGCSFESESARCSKGGGTPIHDVDGTLLECIAGGDPHSELDEYIDELSAGDPYAEAVNELVDDLERVWRNN